MSWILPEVHEVGRLPIGEVKTVLREPRQRDVVDAKYYWGTKRQAWLRSNKEKLREYNREYARKNRRKINAAARRRYRQNQAIRRAYLNAKQREYRAK
jgi:hypothetical protein